MAIPKSVVKAVLKRDSYQCVLNLAGCSGDASVADHRANRGQGGSKTLNALSNLVAACGLCNGAKEDASGAVLADLVARGLRVLPGRTHAHTVEVARATRVTYPCGVTVLLDDEGNKGVTDVAEKP